MTELQRTGGELLVACLEAQGVEVGFGVPGESYLAVLDALHDSPIRFVTSRQEGGATYSASAWGKLTGFPGVAFVTRGPGATNASVGLHTAMQDSSPMVLFVGQAQLGHLEREAFQEVDYRAFFGPIVKWATQIEDVDRIPEIISRAFFTAQNGRPGPVVVALPEDVLSALSVASPGKRVALARSTPTEQSIERTVELLDEAKRPLVLAGGAGWSAQDRAALRNMVEVWNLPLASVFRNNDMVDNFADHYVGDAGVGMFSYLGEAIATADLIVAIGIRFGEMTTSAYTLFEMPDAQQTVVHVHASDREIGKLIQADVAVHCSPGEFAQSVTARAPVRHADRTTHVTKLVAAYERALVAGPQPGPVDLGQITRALNDSLPADAIITSGAGNFSIWPSKHFRYGQDQRFLAPQSGSMGYGLPAAVAAKIAYPDRMVVCFAGDGDFQMNMQELGTALQAGAQPIVIVVNNGTYGTIRMHQEREFAERVSGTDIVNPDFVAIASAYGFHAERVERTDQFQDAFERAVGSATGALIEVVLPTENLSPTATVTSLREASA